MTCNRSLTPSISPARSLAVWGLTLSLVWMVGCGKDEAKKAPAKPKSGATHAAAKVPAGKPATDKKPTPPKLTLPVAKVIAARVTERCALAGKESPLDAHAVAVDQIAGRQYQAVTLAAVKKATAAGGDPASPTPKAVVAKAEAKKVAPAKAPAKKDDSGKAAAPKADAKPAPVGPDAAPAGTTRTPAGRLSPDTDAQRKMMLAYRKDATAAEKWPAYKAQIDAGAKTCLWAPELGLITPKLVDRYVSTFVEVTCLQEKHRGEGGKIDASAHAHASVAVFKKQGFGVREFAELGLIMGRFANVQTDMHKARGELCPDPRIKAAEEAANGSYVGQLKGSFAAQVKLTAKNGKLTGTLTAKRIKGRKGALTIPLEGMIHGARVHLNGVQGQDWVRLDCDGGTANRGCGWSGEVGFKKRKGTWTYKAVKTKPEAPVAPAATAEGKPKPLGKKAPVPAEPKPAKIAPGAASPEPKEKMAGEAPSAGEPAAVE
ncbi:MAG: hypothetical protein KC502_06355 [Myxococcales bacterium]|nr:hypothetical protein [Myxococcales bacterium]